MKRRPFSSILRLGSAGPVAPAPRSIRACAVRAAIALALIVASPRAARAEAGPAPPTPAPAVPAPVVPTPAAPAPDTAAPQSSPRPEGTPSGAAPGPAAAPSGAPPAPREPREPSSTIMTFPAPPPPLPESALAPLETDPERMKVKHRYRKGFLFSLVIGPATLGSGSGYPNDIQKIGVPEHFASSGLLTGSTFQMFIGGALTDYFNFGVLFGGAGMKSDNWEVSAGGAGFRMDFFPLVLAMPKVPALAHLGLGLNFGAGNVRILAKDPQAKISYPAVEGFQSQIGVGLFYETQLFSMLGGHVSLSPELGYHTAYSAAAQVNYGSMMAKLSFYGGP